MYRAETREQPIGVLSADDLEQIFHAEEGDLATRQRERAEGTAPSIGSAATVRGTNVTMGQVDAPQAVTTTAAPSRSTTRRAAPTSARASIRRWVAAPSTRDGEPVSGREPARCSSSAWTVPHDNTISASSATCSP